VSQSFVHKFELTKQLLPTTSRVRGYDGQVAPTNGTLVAPLGLSCPSVPEGVLLDTTPRRAFLVAQLHSDDVILGMPWLAELNADIDFKKQRVYVPLASTKESVELPLLPTNIALPNNAHSKLIDSIMRLYVDSDFEIDKQERAKEQRALHELLSRTETRDTVGDITTMYDDRGLVTSPDRIGRKRITSHRILRNSFGCARSCSRNSRMYFRTPYQPVSVSHRGEATNYTSS
jgi:hypothetical protein